MQSPRYSAVRPGTACCLGLLISTLLFPAGALLSSQEPQIKVNVKVVNVLATVRDKHGQIITNLGKDDFAIDEDGRPQSIAYFSRETDLPLTLGLLVDTSGSQRRVLDDERSASRSFIDSMVREDKDKAFVIHFDREVELLQDLTSSREKLDAALARLQTPRRPTRSERRIAPDVGRWALAGTALYDSVLLASDDLMRNQSGRKALILLTDGVDNGSKIGVSRAIESAQRADTLVYSILFTDDQAYDGVFASANGKKALERISQETGGAFFEVSGAQSITAVYAQLEQELRNQYNIGYTSDRTEGAPGYRKIHLATKRPELKIETRDGYYATR
jgi:VWFA-related protein